MSSILGNGFAVVLASQMLVNRSNERGYPELVRVDLSVLVLFATMIGITEVNRAATLFMSKCPTLHSEFITDGSYGSWLPICLVRVFRMWNRV